MLLIVQTVMLLDIVKVLQLLFKVQPDLNYPNTCVPLQCYNSVQMNEFVQMSELSDKMHYLAS